MAFSTKGISVDILFLWTNRILTTHAPVLQKTDLTFATIYKFPFELLQWRVMRNYLFYFEGVKKVKCLAKKLAQRTNYVKMSQRS